jgi:hypothetical protein
MAKSWNITVRIAPSGPCSPPAARVKVAELEAAHRIVWPRMSVTER